MSEPRSESVSPLPTDSAVQPESTRTGCVLRCPHCHNPIHLTDEPGEEVLCPGCGSNFRIRDARWTQTASVSRPLGRFQLLERVGQGAFGAVWKARDTSLDRIVALKILHTGLGTDEEEMQRFGREARAAAQLRHPGVVTVHEVLTLDGLPVLVADFVQGVTLKELLEVRRLTFRESAQLIADLAEALEYAHSLGVIHRDLKPANVMLEAGGVGGGLGRPLLMDFGLALRDGAEITLTLDGHVLGTPAYMSPEQAAGKSHLADRRSDVYSLGVVLYELLTGELPFRGSKAMLLYQVLTEEPKPPRQLNAKVPRDLETVCLKCLQKEPHKRYQSARELADDLKRYLAGEAVRARPVGSLERAWRWCRRNRVVASMLLLIVVLLLGGTIAATSSLTQAKERARLEQAHDAARKEKERADEQAREAIRQKETAEAAREAERKARQGELREKRRADQLSYFNQLQLAQREWENNHIQHARELLETTQKDLRGWEYDHLNTLINDPQRTLLGHTDTVISVAFSPDGKRIASGGRDSMVKVWDALTGQELLTFKGHTGGVDSVAFSSDGKRIASAGGRGVKVWDATTGKEELTIKDAGGSVSFSPDGKRLASAGRDQTVKVWDAHSGKEQLTLKKQDFFQVNSVAFSPDGKRIASGRSDRTVKVWDAQSGEETVTLRGHAQQVGSVAFSPDGKRIASVSTAWPGPGSEVKVWDVQTGQEAITLKGHTGGVFSVAFSPDGQRIATGGGGVDQKTPRLWGEVKVWDAHTGQEQHTLKGHTDGVLCVAFSPDGKRIASGSWDQTVKVWEAHSGQEPLTFKGHTGGVSTVAFSPDGKRLASASEDKTLKVWDALMGQEALSLKGHTNRVSSVAYSPDGQRIASAGRDQTVKVWDAHSGQELLTLKGHTSSVSSVAFSPDGKRIASGGFDKTVKVWDAHSGQKLLTLKGHTSSVSSVAFSPDGKRIASASEDQTVKVWDAHSGQEALTLKGHTANVYTVAFSPDGKRIASASWDQRVKVWDVQTGQELLSFKGHTEPGTRVAFSPDGKRIASGSWEHTVSVWDAQTGQQLFSLKGHTGQVRCVEFSPDGQRIASGSGDTTVKVWDAHTGQEALNFQSDTSNASIVAFSPDGKRIASGNTDQTVSVWDAQTGQQLLSLKGHTGMVQSLAFSPDGKRLISTDSAKKRIVWDLASGKPLPGAQDMAQDIAQDRQLVSPDGRWFVYNFAVSGIRLVPRLRGEERPRLRWLGLPNPGWHEQQAQDSEGRGDWFSAVFHRTRLLALRPWDLNNQLRRAYDLARLGRSQESAVAYLKVVSLAPHVSLQWLDPAAFQRGEKAAREGKWSDAVEDFRLAAHQPDASLYTWQSLLLAQAAAGRTQEWQQSGREALDRFESTRDLNQVAAMLFTLETLPCAQADTGRVLRLAERLVANQRTAENVHRLGVALYRVGRFEDAARTLEEAIKLHDQDGFPDSWLFLAMAQQRLGRLDDARRGLARFEAWLDKQQFDTWQWRIRWRLPVKEARTLILHMPRAPKGP